MSTLWLQRSKARKDVPQSFLVELLFCQKEKLPFWKGVFFFSPLAPNTQVMSRTFQIQDFCVVSWLQRSKRQKVVPSTVWCQPPVGQDQAETEILLGSCKIFIKNSALCLPPPFPPVMLPLPESTTKQNCFLSSPRRLCLSLGGCAGKSMKVSCEPHRFFAVCQFIFAVFQSIIFFSRKLSITTAKNLNLSTLAMHSCVYEGPGNHAGKSYYRQKKIQITCVFLCFGWQVRLSYRRSISVIITLESKIQPV